MPPDDARVRRDLRAIRRDGMAFALMVGIGETYLPAFVLAIGGGEVEAGLVATLPLLVGALIQLVSPRAVERLGSQKRWVVLCARLQAASFLPLALLCFVEAAPVAGVFVLASAYWAAGMGTTAAWNTWVETLVPRPERERFFARRARVGQMALLASVLAGGALLEAGMSQSRPLGAFAVLFALAAAFRLASARYLASQSEPVALPAQLQHVGFAGFLRGLRQGAGSRLLSYTLTTQLVVHVAAPFFTPYMLEQLSLSYAAFTAITAAAFLGRILALPLLGRLAHRVGAQRVLWLGAFGVVPLPVLWLVSGSVPYLVTLQLLAGMAWGAFELATLLAIFDQIEPRVRISVLTYYNLATAGAVVAGSLLGTVLFREAGPGAAAYVAVFVASTLGRLVPLLILRGARPVPGDELPTATRTLAVRPNAGGLQRPVLAGMEGPPAPDGEPRA